MKRTALVIGATGLVGSCLVKRLLQEGDYGSIKVFVRRPTGMQHPKLEEYVVDFDALTGWRSELKGDVLFSALGTTIRKAGSKANQFKVDYTYQYEVAKAASENKVGSYLLVSSIGANSKSKVFYPQIKGKLDEAVQKLAFGYTWILRPSALVGKRSEERTGEKVMIPVMNLVCRLFPFARKYQPIHADSVALAMINLASRKEITTSRVIENPEIFQYAGNTPEY